MKTFQCKFYLSSLPKINRNKNYVIVVQFQFQCLCIFEVVQGCSQCHIMSYFYIILNMSCVADEYMYFLILKCTLGRRLGTDFLQIFKHVTGSLVDLFNSCQLHISYTTHAKLFFKVLDQGKTFSLFAWLHGGRKYNKKSD